MIRSVKAAVPRLTGVEDQIENLAIGVAKAEHYPQAVGGASVEAVFEPDPPKEDSDVLLTPEALAAHLAALALRRGLMPLAAAPPLLWLLAAAIVSPGLPSHLGVLAVCQTLALIILALLIRGPLPSVEGVSKISFTASSVLFGGAAIHSAVAPQSMLAIPLMAAGALVASWMPTIAGLRKLSYLAASVWTIGWIAQPDTTGWFMAGAGLIVSLILATLGRSATNEWQADRIGDIDRLRNQYQQLLQSAQLAVGDNGTQRLLDAHGEMDGLWEWNLKTDQIYFSPRWRALLGFDEMVSTGDPDTWFNLIHPYDLDELMNRLTSHLEGKSAYFECEHRVRQADGSYRWVLSHGRVVIGADGRPERLAGSQTDIKRMKNFEAQLIHEATHDRLTGLANRNRLLETLGEEFRRCKGQATYLFAVAFLDLDRFKSVNDTLGHHVGDELLRTVAERLQRAVRDHDLVARLGGDEFVVVMRGVKNAEHAIEIAQRICDRLAERVFIGAHEISSPASIGLALNSSENQSASEIMRNADIAMYQAKAAGRGRVLRFDSEMRDLVNRNFNLQNDLAKAIENNEFELHYQPFVRPVDGRIMGAEALIRWRRSPDDLVFPVEFIGLAEETGMIGAIGEWVFNHACMQLAEWISEGIEPIKISINFSAIELAEVNTSEIVARALKEWRLEPKWLQVEITESDLVDGRQSTVESLDRFNLLGISTAIDDFGTGYSALSYLRKLTCNVLKIDQLFVRDIESDPKAASLARSIISMAHSLELEVVAEGVETKGQLAILRDYDCDLIQGYLASRPIPAAAFKELLSIGCATAMGIEATKPKPTPTTRSRTKKALPRKQNAPKTGHKS